MRVIVFGRCGCVEERGRGVSLETGGLLGLPWAYLHTYGWLVAWEVVCYIDYTHTCGHEYQSFKYTTQLHFFMTFLSLVYVPDSMYVLESVCVCVCVCVCVLACFVCMCGIILCPPPPPPPPPHLLLRSRIAYLSWTL